MLKKVAAAAGLGASGPRAADLPAVRAEPVDPQASRAAGTGRELQAWQVTSIRDESRFDVHDDLFTRDGEHVLVLVTCGGRVIDGHFEHNVIATAKPQP